MPKALCMAGTVIAALLFLVFGLDFVTSSLLETAFPFQGASKTMDVAFMICAAVLGYLSWTTMREQV